MWENYEVSSLGIYKEVSCKIKNNSVGLNTIQAGCVD